MSLRGRKRTQSGSALIEFALSATLIVMLAIGSVSFGLAVQQSIIVADAANAGALAGANGTYWATYTSGMQTVSGVAGAGVQNFTATASYFCECTAGGSAVTCTSACGNDQPLYYVKVTTSATFNNFFHYLGLPATFTLQSTSVMPVQ
jgi:Flp pilus assembly protein TadG